MVCLWTVRGVMYVDSKGWTVRGVLSMGNKGRCVCGQ